MTSVPIQYNKSFLTSSSNKFSFLYKLLSPSIKYVSINTGNWSQEEFLRLRQIKSAGVLYLPLTLLWYLGSVPGKSTRGFIICPDAEMTGINLTCSHSLRILCSLVLPWEPVLKTHFERSHAIPRIEKPLSSKLDI